MVCRSVSPLLGVVLLVSCATPPAAAQQPAPRPAPKRAESKPPPLPGVPTTPDNVHLPTEGEIKLGRETAVEVEKHYKIIDSGPYHERLQRIAGEIAKAIQRDDIIQEYKRVYNLPKRGDRSRRVPFEYSFKVVDETKEVNAFSLAGGPIYVTKGLMDEAASDDELAAVLAHECAHVAFHHVEQLIKKQKKANAKQIWGLLAAIVAGVAGGGGAAQAAGNVLVGAQLVSIATMTGYGRELEHEADRMGVRALASTRYHPAAMLTFMQKLAYDDRLRGNRNLGIFQSHPYPNERIVEIRKQVEELGYRADIGIQRKLNGSFQVTVVPQRINGRDVAELRLNDRVMFIVGDPDDAGTPLARARRIAEEMEQLFQSNFTFNDVHQSEDRQVLFLKGIPVIRVFSLDAATGEISQDTDRALKEINAALWSEKLKQN